MGGLVTGSSQVALDGLQARCALLCRDRLGGDDMETPRRRTMKPAETELGAAEASALVERALFEAKRVLVGQDHMIERLFVCWLANGHCLLEGAPGLAKTLA